MTICEIESFKEQPIVKQRVTLGKNGRLSSPEELEDYLSQETSIAQYEFLEEIHRTLIQKDIEVAENGGRKPDYDDRSYCDYRAFLLKKKNEEEDGMINKPELCDEYLIKIGRPDLINLGL